MRDLIVSVIASLDAFTAATPDQGGVMALPMDHAFDQHNAEVLRDAGSLLLGATTYRQFLTYWPHALDADTVTPAVREIAEVYAGGFPITVASDTLTPEECGPWRDQTTVVGRAGLATAVDDLKAGVGGSILVYGSSSLTHELLRLGLVDQYDVLWAPVLLGAGVAAFPADTQLALTRTSLRTWDDSHNVLISYRT